MVSSSKKGLFFASASSLDNPSNLKELGGTGFPACAKSHSVLGYLFYLYISNSCLPCANVNQSNVDSSAAAPQPDSFGEGQK
jgi:hypothetical protein